MSATKQLRQLAAQLPGAIDAIDNELKTVSHRMMVLKRAGLIYASEHWRENKYLYLIYPMHGGDRRREYIGADVQRIDEAREGIARGKEFDQLSVRLTQLEARMNNGVAALQEAGRQLRSWRQ